MEYSFSRDDNDEPVAYLNMEAEAFGHWLNIEMGESNLDDLRDVFIATGKVLQGTLENFSHTGREFTLELNSDQARVSANALIAERGKSGDADFGDDNDSDDMADHSDDMADDNEYDDEALAGTDSGSSAHGGIEDFHELLCGWVVFLEEK